MCPNKTDLSTLLLLLLLRALLLHLYVSTSSSEHSEPPRKRSRPLEEAVRAEDGVALKFADSFASDNQNLSLLQVRLCSLAFYDTRSFEDYIS